MMERIERNYGIDLLRLVLMFMICMLHILRQGGILNACEVGSVEYQLFWLVEMICYGAVDSFAIISGYFAIAKPQKYEKLVDMWFQAFFYSFVLTLVFTLLGIKDSWSIKEIIRYAMPITFGQFWYFSAYVVLFLAIPMCNRFVFALDETASKRTLVILVILFSIIGLVDDAFALQKGYSAIWLMALYVTGALAKRIKLFETKKTGTLVLIWMLCTIGVWASKVYGGTEILVNYVSFPILLNSMIAVILFSRLSIKGRMVNKLSRFAFGIYLFQMSPVIWNRFLKNAFAFAVKEPLLIGICYAFAGAATLFLCGLMVEWIRSMLAKQLHLSSFSKKLVAWIDKGVDNLCMWIQ